MSTSRPDAAGALERFVAGALAREGAMVEPWADGLDVVLPPTLAAELRVGEYERLTFDAENAGDGTLPVDYDAPIVEALGEPSPVAPSWPGPGTGGRRRDRSMRKRCWRPPSPHGMASCACWPPRSASPPMWAWSSSTTC